MTQAVLENRYEEPERNRRSLHQRVERTRPDAPRKANRKRLDRRRDLRRSAYASYRPQRDCGLIGAVHERFPNFRFSLLGEPDGFGTNVRFSWGLGPQFPGPGFGPGLPRSSNQGTCRFASRPAGATPCMGLARDGAVIA